MWEESAGDLKNKAKDSILFLEKELADRAREGTEEKLKQSGT